MHKRLAELSPQMKTSAKMCGAWEEKATLVLQDTHVERMLQTQNVYIGIYIFFFFSVVHYSALVLSLAASFPS